jgi:hypothetical protein
MQSIKFIFICFIFICSFLSANAQISETEPNDTFGTANNIDISSGSLNISSSINPVGDQDKFRFTITEPRYITFETFDTTGTGCSSLDTVIRLYNSVQTEIAVDDNSGINQCSKAASAIVPGTYYIHVEDFANNNTIPAYLIRISVVPRINEIEPNNSIAEANANGLVITSSTDIRGESGASGWDYFKITLDSPKVVSFGQYNLEGGCPSYTNTLSIFDSYGEFFRGSYVSPCSLATLTLPASTYYFRHDVTLTSTDFIRFLINPSPNVVELEANDTFTQANQSPLQINSNLDVVGAINPAGDVDRYRVNLSQGSNVTFETFSDTNGTACNSIDTLIRLYNSSGTELIFDDDTGINNCSLISNVNLPAGIYYIQAAAFSSAATIPQYLLRTTITPDLSTRKPFDYDGDGKSDISVFRPSNGGWYIQRSASTFYAVAFGAVGDKVVPADFSGDGKTDVGIFRPSDNTWYVFNTANNTFYGIPFGTAGDIPVPEDFDGDGKADINVFRPSSGMWFRNNSSNGQFVATPFGQNGDVPTVGDFDGDGKADIGVWRPSNGAWYRLNSNNNSFFAVAFGQTGDKVVPADYTGDGKTDIAVFRSGTWYILRSEDLSFYGIPFGLATDIPSPGDFDGDGKADQAVYRNGQWFIQQSTSGFLSMPFGLSTDTPTESAFVY